MKFLVLLGDGMADFPVAALDNHTPLQAATTPAMDQAVTQGVSGLFKPIPDAYPAGSDIGNLSVFGYDPDEAFTGRAPLEAANQGIFPAQDQLVFRCNFVTLEDNRMRDFTADHISTEEAHALVDSLNRSLPAQNLQFIGGVSYRNLCLLTLNRSIYSSISLLSCTPPHDILMKPYAPHLPKGDRREVVLDIMNAAAATLREHPVNERRVDSGKLPANAIWLWGQGAAPKITPFADRFGITGAVVSAVDLVNGIGRCAGFEVLSVPGITGYVDTNYEGKVAAALDALDRHDFVYLHVEAPDEAAHEGDPALKVRAIEDFDERVVQPCLDAARDRGDLRILIAPDHITSLDSRTHAAGPVPFVLWGPAIAPNGLTSYSEAEAAKAGILFDRGHELVPTMIAEREIAFPPVA